MVENFTLLLSNDIKRAKCDMISTHVLLGIENNFLGFYCYVHGIVMKAKLEEKYQFEQEMNKGKIVTRRRRRTRRRKSLKR